MNRRELFAAGIAVAAPPARHVVFSSIGTSWRGDVGAMADAIVTETECVRTPSGFLCRVWEVRSGERGRLIIEAGR